MRFAPPAARRGFALVALATGAASLVLTATVLLRDPLEVIAAVLLVGCAIAAAWAALVHRGRRRIAAAAIAVLALAATAALPDLRAYLWFLVVAALVALSAGATRAALGQASSSAVSRTGPARHGVLLVNPRSGGGKATWFGLADKARALGVEPFELRPGDDLRTLAEQAVANGADVLGMAGGDGSQALVADVARQHGVAFVCVPAGTRNHFALDLGLDRDDVPAALAAFGDAVERRVDLAELNGRVFVNNVSLGVYAAAVQSPAYRDAKAATVVRQLPDLLGPDAQRPDLRFALPDGTRRESADLLLVSNDPYRLKHLSGFGTRERLDAGTLGIVTVTVNRAAEVPALISAEIAGRISRFSGYRSWSAPEFVVDSGRPLIEASLDGEAMRLAPPLRFRILPGALRVRVPRDAPGTSPAATLPSGTRATVVALLQVLGGRAS
ncbi:diacylglycerol kinase family enzyme [Kibdelosporangium banguiense]|uniref:Diacylglycerol kinase family enzyme n=1 Tax=Kibdelosporangium banguiense TaxID=1365924 RepID=A0ABS4TW40_9PSEU|nr:diacylglycerol kinase family protein [Kibdelosporangium banguiense]MBP2328609.1 diacylglycerol kinase family enzyme [Kibdelosporangium banguiense]